MARKRELPRLPLKNKLRFGVRELLDWLREKEGAGDER
jgi:hypothetical protein